MTAFIAAILITLGGACVTAEFIQQWSQTDASEALGVVYDQHSDGVIAIGSKRIAQTSNSDALCALFRASTGALIWQKEIHMNTNDRATAAVADVESIFVVGTGQGGTQSGSFAVKHNKTDGSLIWSVQAGGSGSVNRNAKAVALSNNGSLLFLAGSLCDSGVQLDGAKCYAYVETLRISTGASVGVHKFGPGNADEVRAVGVDSSGGLYLAGRTKGALSNLHSEAVAAQNGQYDYFLVKMSAATGAIQWSQQGKGTANDMANSLVIYSNFVYITGVSYHLSLPFAFWSSFDLSDGSRRDDFNGLAGEAHSIVITPGLQGVDGPFITGQDGSQLFVHKYQLGRKTVAKHSVAANAGKTLGGGYSALVTAVDGGGIIAKAIALGGTQTATSTAEKSYVVQRLELINNCSASICGQNGDCIDLIDDFQCRCHAGYEGESCENEIDECQTNQCQNMGSCLDGIASYTCVCTPGFTGVHCEVDIDDCVPNPCVNGSCNDLITDFHCICDSGWEGKTCAKNIDDCRGISCGPGVCHDLLAAYTCTCPAGFSGQHCEINIDDCASNPCMNGGQCVDGIDSYTCMCLSGTSPPNCVDDVNECLPSPCLNEGVCTPGIGTFTCKCKQGYVGQRCEAAAGHCDSNPCQNGGKCSVLASGFYCTCPRGFKGRMCENQMPTPCQLSPCQNEGTCFATTTESFTCTCRDPYTGPTCNEIDITALSNADVTSTNAEDVAQSFNKAAQDPSTLEVNDISNFAKLTSKLFGVGDLSHVAIDNTFDALSSLLGTPTEVLDAAHNRDNSSAMLSQSLETFGEHVLRPEMERTEISKGNIALTAELFKHQLPSSGHYLTFQIIGKRTLPESESLSLSPISGINSIKTQPKQQVYGILQLPKSLLSDITTAKPFVLNTVAFRDSRFFPGLLPVGSVVNSLVLSVRLNSSSTRHLREPVTFSLRLEAHLSNVTRPQCVWWDYTAYNKKGNWSTAGCTTLLSSLTKDGHVYVNCSCTHLTNFAVVIRAPTDTAQSDSKDDKNERVLHYITLTFGPLSMLSLGVTIFLILTIKILRENQAMQIVLNLCLALLLTMLFFVMGIERSSNTNWCRASAILIHFFALSSFAWMLIEGVNFYLHMVRVFSYRSKKIVLKYAIFGWGVPLLIVLAAIVTDVRSDGGVYVRDDVCWISSKGWFYGSFIAPVCLVLLVNIIIFVMLAKVIRSTQSGIQEKNARVRKLKILCAVAILMGFPWLFLAFAWGDQRVIFDYLFTIFATLQGFIIFLFNIFFNREVQNIICAAHLKGVRKVAKASKKQLEDMESMGSACDSISSSGEYLFHQDSSPPRRSFLSWFFKSSKSSPNSDFSVSTMSTSVASNSLNSSLSRKNSHKSSADSTKILVPKRRDSKTVMKDKQEVCRPAANESPMSEFSMAPLPTDAFSDLPYAHVNTKFYEKSDGRGGESV